MTIRLVCPADPKHGSVYAVPLGWYCPHVAHDGFRDEPRTRAFFTTAEIDAGHTTPHTAAGTAQEPRNATSGASAQRHWALTLAVPGTRLAVQRAAPPLPSERARPESPVPEIAALRRVRVPTGAHLPALAAAHPATGRDNPRH